MVIWGQAGGWMFWGDDSEDPEGGDDVNVGWLVGM